MSLDDIYKLLIEAVDALSDDFPSDSKLTLQQKLYYANIYFAHLKYSHDEELSENQNDLYPQEVVDLYIEIKALMENLEIDERANPQQPLIIIDADKAQIIKEKMVGLHDLIESKIHAVDSLYDSYFSD